MDLTEICSQVNEGAFNSFQNMALAHDDMRDPRSNFAQYDVGIPGSY